MIISCFIWLLFILTIPIEWGRRDSDGFAVAASLHTNGGRKDNTTTFTWPSLPDYYFSSVRLKLVEMTSLSKGDNKCFGATKFLMENTLPDYITTRTSPDFVSISTFPPSPELVSWWYSIPRPRQMRVDPLLCDHPFTRKRPIFNNSGCQLPGYMHPAAPRCQTQYLKWICDHARLPMQARRGNGFVLPESDHGSARVPPYPWLMTVNQAFVSMCGDIVSSCGIIHTKSNCMGMRQQYEAKLFQRSCNVQQARRIFQSLLTKENASFTCESSSPWNQRKVKYVERVFVVAEVDDTFVYHIHVGK